MAQGREGYGQSLSKLSTQQEDELRAKFQLMFQDSLKDQEQLRIRGYREISAHAKGFFQEWLDGNALGSFHQVINKKSALANDWVNLMNICSHMKFYSVGTVNKMALFVKDKWISSSVRHPDPDVNCAAPPQTRPIDKFIQFNHVSPYVLQLLDNLTSLAGQVQAHVEKSKDAAGPMGSSIAHGAGVEASRPYLTPGLLQEIQTFVKTCSLLEVFCYNHLNQLLIQKIQGPAILMQNLMKVLKSLQLLQDSTERAEKQVIVAVFKCLAVCLRQECVIEAFVRHKNLYLLKILQLLKDHSTSESVVSCGMAVMR